MAKPDSWRRPNSKRRRAICGAFFLSLIAASNCTPLATDPFAAWLVENPARGEVLARFEAFLNAENVHGVFPVSDLWMVDQHRPECVSARYAAPPETLWPTIVPTLRYIRDHVTPAVGKVKIVSGWRDQTFNACVGGASQSKHLTFGALDLVPMDKALTREDLIARLCPMHAASGPRNRTGLGIYPAVRFHIDTGRFRGWGADFRGASFPCLSTPAPTKNK